MPDKILTIHDPTGHLSDDVRKRALASAAAVLEHYGVTIEECAEIGTRPFKEVAPGGVHNFFDGVGKAATTWLEAVAVVHVICGEHVQLRIDDSPDQLLH